MASGASGKVANRRFACQDCSAGSSSTAVPFTGPRRGPVRAFPRAFRYEIPTPLMAALRALDPTLPDESIAALCVTEADGNFPRALRTTLTPEDGGFVVSGEKRWTTLGPDGGVFVVIAREAGTDETRPSLKAVRIASGTPGLAIEPMPPTSFVPEVPHARLRLDQVRVAPSAGLEADAKAASAGG